MVGAMAVGRDKMAGLYQMTLARLAQAETQEHSPAETVMRSGVLMTSGAIVATLNGYFDNPKVVGLVGVDGVVGVAAHAAFLIASYVPSLRAKLGGTTFMVGHTVADAALMNYVAKVFNGLGAQMASKKTATAGYGGQFQHMAGVGALSADEATRYVR